jgi:hypothetical protein
MMQQQREQLMPVLVLLFRELEQQKTDEERHVQWIK